MTGSRLINISTPGPLKHSEGVAAAGSRHHQKRSGTVDLRSRTPGRADIGAVKGDST